MPQFQFYPVHSAGDVTGFVFPNEFVNWEILIVLYPYITGLVAGAFIASALYHVFGRQELKPVSRLALILSACLLIGTPMPLQTHLAQPQRATNIFLTPNFTSAMAGFGYIYLTYSLIVLMEIFFVYRTTFIDYAERGKGLKRFLGRILTVIGTRDRSPEALATDHRMGYRLAVIGIPAACFLHGYVGFIFGSVKANPYWATPLMPFVFLVSAVVSGIALLMLVYPIVATLSKQKIDMKAMHGLGQALWYFFALDLAFHFVSYIYIVYTKFASMHAIETVLHERLAFTYLGGEWLLGGIIPWLLLIGRGGVGRVGLSRAMVAAALFQFGIFSMRWDVVIGGQLFSKSLAGFLTYSAPIFWMRESWLVAAAIMAVPFIALPIVNWLLPWQVPEGEEGH
jgi:Ni/Fe-hydrogenase subunit HybB-like protein